MALGLEEAAGRRQLARFVAVGLLNTGFGYGTYALLLLAKLGPGLALFIATVLGVVFNYLTTGHLVFAERGFGRLPFFVAFYGLTFLLNLWSLKLLIAVGMSPLLAQAALLPLMVILNFALNKLFVFRS